MYWTGLDVLAGRLSITDFVSIAAYIKEVGAVPNMRWTTHCHRVGAGFETERLAVALRYALPFASLVTASVRTHHLASSAGCHCESAQNAVVPLG